MRLDQYSNPIFNEQDLIDALYKGQKLSADMFVEPTNNVKVLEEQSNLKFWIPLDDYDLPIEEYDSAMQGDWQMPDNYKSMDIEEWIWEQCPPWDPQHTRVSEELAAFKERNMLDLLRWLKYFVDTCTEQNIVWGVGRGSSVASYVLFLIGVHAVDSIKYNLDWQEFLR
jgi:DNA polymerase III alpha subunit